MRNCRLVSSALIGRVFTPTVANFAIRTGVALMLGAGIAGCNAKKEPVAVVQPVQVMSVTFLPREESWTYVGSIRPRYESDLGFRVGGKIVARLVDVGQTVQAGQTLARLDPTDLRLALQSQEAELHAAESARDQAVAAEQRAKALIDKGFMARATLDQRSAAADEARSRVDRAQKSLSLAHNQLDYAELKSDQAGVVSALPVEVGQVVAAGQLVVRVARLDTLEAQVEVPEQMIEAVKGAEVRVAVWGGGDKSFAAHLREVSPVADRVSRTYQTRFTIDAADADLRMGRTATVRLRRPGEGEVAHVPLSALLNDGAGPAVFVVDAQAARVRRTPVKLVSLGAGEAIIASGPASGDRVVTMGVHMLDEGKPVRVVEQRADAR